LQVSFRDGVLDRFLNIYERQFLILSEELTRRSRIRLPSRVESLMPGNVHVLRRFPVLDWESVITFKVLRDEEAVASPPVGTSSTVGME
jgi:hypothetical protein